jgi:hypothetical protein
LQQQQKLKKQQIYEQEKENSVISGFKNFILDTATDDATSKKWNDDDDELDNLINDIED